ncbi:hypothetical protein TRFO_11581 [Tritrichomonas foetus]|uniref:Uncharacterized protein n=1 Tax=Tritrichomonas foetus TaxID=1144522 RepID=A0A1J4J347_9EUKA|nr:hypothetical protein TRFO_11581 [Tritrichomonas foetus]|eukprot:OHS93778.1 hypothetical protein TRFO_11581 [Tritrichomonas foetus]
MELITALFHFKAETEYLKWKKQCQNIIEQIKPIVISVNEEQLDIIFEMMKNELKNEISTFLVEDILCNLSKIAIISYFISDFDITPHFGMIELGFHNSNHIISRCCGKLIYWLSKQSQNVYTLFRKLIYQASVWIRCAPLVDLWYNSLVILAYAAKTNDSQGVKYIRDLSTLIVHYLLSSDREYQTISIKIIRYYIPHCFIYFKKNRTIITIENAISIIRTVESNNAIGAIKLLKYLYQNDTFMDADHITKIANDIILCIRIQKKPADYMLCKLLLFFLCKFQIQVNFQELIEILIGKSLRFTPLIAKIIRLSYTNLVDLLPIITFIKEQINNCSRENCVFIILKELLKHNKEIDLGINIPLENYCIHFCQCIKIKNELFNVQHVPIIRQYFFNPTFQENEKLSAFKIIRLFPNLFFNTNEEYIRALSIFFKSDSVKLRKETVKSLAKIDNNKSTDILITFACFDKSKEVRVYAIEHIKPSSYLAGKIQLFQCHNDSCFKVRRKAIKLTSGIIQMNHIEFDPLVWQYYDKMVILLMTSHNSKLSAKIASLFPYLFTEFDQMYDYEHFATFSIALILKFIGSPEKNYHIPLPLKHGIDKIQIFDLLSSDSLRKAKINKLIRQSNIDKRDGYLIETLANIGAMTEPYLNEILDTFCYIFETRKSEALLLKTVNSLILLSSKLYDGLNIRLRCPKIIRPLLKIAMETKNVELGISLLKLFGSAFDSIDAEKNIKSPIISYKTGDCYFYTDFIIKSILELIPDSSLPFYTTITMILESDSIYAAKYIPDILLRYLKTIDNSPIEIQDILFSYLEVIPYKYKNEIEPYSELLSEFILKYIKLISCIKFAESLCFSLGFSLINYANVIYQTSISLLNNSTFEYFNELMNLIVLMIIHQNMSFEIFLYQLESHEYIKMY